MYKSTYDLNANQLDELRWAIFYSDEDFWIDEIENAGITDPAEIPDEWIHTQYAGVLFTDDDFSCTAWDGCGQLPHTLPF